MNHQQLQKTGKKRKTDHKTDTRMKISEHTTDIRTFFTPLTNKESHASHHQNEDKKNGNVVIIID